MLSSNSLSYTPASLEKEGAGREESYFDITDISLALLALPGVLADYRAKDAGFFTSLPTDTPVSTLPEK